MFYPQYDLLKAKEKLNYYLFHRIFQIEVDNSQLDVYAADA